MFRKNKILAVIPARQGSKGIKDKNLLKLNNKTLVGLAIECALNSDYIDRIVLSSDSKRILSIGKKYKIDLHHRSKKIAGDKSKIINTLKNILSLNIYREFDTILLLQPTSPFRETLDLDNALKKFCKIDKFSSLTSVVKCGDNHPARMYKTKFDKLIPLNKNLMSELRQNLPTIYLRNGAIYIFRKENIHRNNLYGDKIAFYEMPPRKSINIDEEVDYFLAKIILKKGK